MDIVNLVALVIGVVALLFAVKQQRDTNHLLRETRTAANNAAAAVTRLDELVNRTEAAAQAAESAARRTTLRLLGMQVLVLSMQMMEMEREITEAVVTPDRARLNRGLMSWHQMAVQLLGMLGVLGLGEPELVRRVQDCVMLTGSAADDVLGAKESDIDRVSKAARHEVMAVTSRIGQIATQFGGALNE